MPMYSKLSTAAAIESNLQGELLMNCIKMLLVFLLTISAAAAQTSILPTNNLWLGTNTYNGGVVFNSTVVFDGFTSIVLPATTSTCVLNGDVYLNPGCYAGLDIGAQINTAAASCTNPRGCVIHIPNGLYTYTTPIVLQTSGNYPLTLQCDPGGDSTGTFTGSSTLYFTATSGIAITYNDAAPGGGISGCTIEGVGSTNTTIGLYVEVAIGSLFQNIQIGLNNTLGFGTGLEINTASGQVYLTDFYKLYVRGNNAQLLLPPAGSTTNENINFFGGVFAGYGTYNPTCAILANFEGIQFYGVSWDGCPVSIQGGAHSHFTFFGNHFESVLSGTYDFISITSGCAPCEVTLNDPQFVEDTSASRTELISTAATGTLTVIAPEAYLQETVQSLVSKSNTAGVVQVTNPFVAQGAISYNVYNTNYSNADFGLTGVTGNRGNGFYQSVRATAGCNTGTAFGNTCASAVVFNWLVPWGDANYSLTCTGAGPTNVPGPVYWVIKNSTQASFNYVNLATNSSLSSWGVVDCIGVHD
jgi:hypothetical protein